MLTADLVRARRRGRELVVARLEGRSRARALHLAEAYLSLAQDHIGASRGDFEEACDAVLVNPRERKLALGIRKLVEDQCSFEADDSVDARTMREQVFRKAAAARRALADHERLDEAAVLEQVAEERGRDERGEDLLQGLYADLREAHLLTGAPVTTATALVEEYDLAQAQAVLLRATRVVAEVACASPAAYRHLFGKLKFRRLLYSIRPTRTGGYVIEIDGPYSLFSSVTKYGLQLALLLPSLRACDEWSLRASLLWGKEREPLSFSLSGKKPGQGRARPVDDPAAEPAELERDLPEEVAALVASVRALACGWDVAASTDVLDLPGLGVCVPDLRFRHHATATQVYLEVLGFWSRDAVWRRVELVRAGLPHRILFAVPKRLRVSERVLEDDLPGALYVYKGTMNAKAVIDRLDALVPPGLAEDRDRTSAERRGGAEGG